MRRSLASSFKLVHSTRRTALLSSLSPCRCNARKFSTQQPGGSSLSTDTSSTTHFGFKTVLENEKESLVGQVFGNVAKSYDVMNDVMSGGVHRLWKDHFIRTLAPGPDTNLLDVAGGTGDIAFRFLDYVKNIHGLNHDAHVTVLDINPAMLAVGQERARTLGFSDEKRIRFTEGNAEKLAAIPSSSVDAYTIAFGIRNCTHVDAVLSEAFRVLKPGGRFMCLEFSKVALPVIKELYDVYSFNVIPMMGELVAKDRESYQYLVESIRQFPNQERFAEMISEAGFKSVGKPYENLFMGVAAIHSGFKI
ncbi:demethylmenaquinone methyltransferase [Synchytrium microbalum]|uniref:2-methoxy-6-polyprenyl-1,4-benzoquinol methylase, mitochondrial n=1 Tax=Synchytrium microbalum TaxID=1806994 RepID=A0A507CCG2_9FUNG|nr:demethylmenaquinone methyltransferase [Synchytrium microbalum]TPX35233.1 demethylmenaquinone methyltransferase [Synchytrium microbalum]